MENGVYNLVGSRHIPLTDEELMEANAFVDTILTLDNEGDDCEQEVVELDPVAFASHDEANKEGTTNSSENEKNPKAPAPAPSPTRTPTPGPSSGPSGSSTRGGAGEYRRRRDDVIVPPPGPGSVVVALPAMSNYKKHLDAAAGNNNNKFKAVEMPRTFNLHSLHIGSWKKERSERVKLSGSIHFGWENIVWEMEEQGAKQRRIIINWDNISHLNIIKDGDREFAGLALKLSECPLFTREKEISPITGRTIWESTADFTLGEAQRHWHIIKCCPDVSKENVELLFKHDKRLLKLSKAKPGYPQIDLNQPPPMNHDSLAEPSANA